MRLEHLVGPVSEEKLGFPSGLEEWGVGLSGFPQPARVPSLHAILDRLVRLSRVCGGL